MTEEKTSQKANNRFNYTEAQEEIIKILDDLQSGEIEVDVLIKKVQRAKTLIQKCQEQLTAIENEASSIFPEIE